MSKKTQVVVGCRKSSSSGPSVAWERQPAMSNKRPSYEELLAGIISGQITTVEEPPCGRSVRTKAAQSGKAQS